MCTAVNSSQLQTAGHDQSHLEFQESFEASASYPCNIIKGNAWTNTAILEAFKARLDKLNDTLFVESDAEVEIAYRDFVNWKGQRKLSRSRYHFS